MIKLYSAPTDGYTNIEYFKAGGSFGAGAALALGNTGLTISATAPTYLSLSKSTDESMEFEGLVGAIAIVKDAVYSATLSVAGTSLKVGDKVTLAATADKITATTTNGIFQITGFATEDQAIGDTVYGKFVL